MLSQLLVTTPSTRLTPMPLANGEVFGNSDSQNVWRSLGQLSLFMPGIMLANSVGKGKTIVEFLSPAMKLSELR